MSKAPGFRAGGIVSAIPVTRIWSPNSGARFQRTRTVARDDCQLPPSSIASSRSKKVTRLPLPALGSVIDLAGDGDLPRSFACLFRSNCATGASSCCFACKTKKAAAARRSVNRIRGRRKLTRARIRQSDKGNEPERRRHPLRRENSDDRGKSGRDERLAGNGFPGGSMGRGKGSLGEASVVRKSIASPGLVYMLGRLVPTPFSRKRRTNVTRTPSKNGAGKQSATRVSLKPGIDWHKRNFLTEVLVPSLFTKRSGIARMPLFPKVRRGRDLHHLDRARFVSPPDGGNECSDRSELVDVAESDQAPEAPRAAHRQPALD